MGERDDARREVEQKRERMSRIAYEVSRRLTPGYAKERAREMARERMYGARDRAVESSWFAPLLGAGVGALLGRALQSRAQERRHERDERFGWRRDFERRGFAYGYPRGSYAATEEYDEYGAAAAPEDLAGDGGKGASLGDKASQLEDRARETTEQVKERARASADQVKERLRDATSELKERLPGRERIRASAHEDTAFWALGAMALGALFGFALPETQREREMLGPARRKARELGQQAKEKALEQGSAALDKATEKVAGMGAGQQPASAPGEGASPGALH